MSVPDTTPAPPSLSDAAAATQALFDSPDNQGGAVNEPTAQPQVDPGVTPDAGTAPETPPAPLAWDNIDLSVLPEDAQKVIKDGYLRHSDYTRKTQELAEQRKQIEQYGDPETVQQAVEFVSQLQDPEFLRQLKSDIDAHLGLTAAAPDGTAPLPDQTSLGLDPAIQRQLDDLAQFKANFEHERQEAQLVDQMTEKLQTAEDSIRSDYPSYTQADIDAIYKLSPGVGFDLFEAQKQYEEFRNHFTKELVGNKDQIPNVANNVRSDALYHQPTEIQTMEDAKAAAAQLFAQA